MAGNTERKHVSKDVGSGGVSVVIAQNPDQCQEHVLIYAAVMQAIGNNNPVCSSIHKKSHAGRDNR